MARSAALASVALLGLTLAGCAGGFAQAGLSLPAADGVQTVSDAADALDGHRTTGSDNAKAAIAATDALGAFVRDISAGQRALTGGERRATRSVIRLLRDYSVDQNGRRILSGTELVVRSGSAEYCQSSTGFTVNGIPSLDDSFGWQGATFSSGTRTTDNRGSSVWSARANGAVVQGAIGNLSIVRGSGAAGCPMSAPAFVLKGGSAQNAFSLPLSVTFRRGTLFNLSVVDGKFASGESLEVTTQTNRQPVEVDGTISNGRTEVATFRANATGSGTLTITSTGAQYVIADWIVVGT